MTSGGALFLFDWIGRQSLTSTAGGPVMQSLLKQTLNKRLREVHATEIHNQGQGGMLCIKTSVMYAMSYGDYAFSFKTPCSGVISVATHMSVVPHVMKRHYQQANNLKQAKLLSKQAKPKI